MVVTKTFMNRMKNKLNSKHCLSDDFLINVSKDDSYDIKIEIIYIYKTNYTFRGLLNPNANEFISIYSPGEIMNSEEHIFTYLDSFFDSLTIWIKNIESEMKSEPLLRRVNEHEKILRDIKNKLNTMEDEGYFSPKEENDFIDRLEKLEAAFTEKIETDQEEGRNLKAELKSLTNEIETLKVQLGSLTKKNWYLSFATRLYYWFKRNPNATRQLAGFTRELLPSSAKDVVSQEALDQLLPVPDQNEE